MLEVVFWSFLRFLNLGYGALDFIVFPVGPP